MRNTQLTEKQKNDFDFDYWLELAQSSPDGFETMRSEYIEAFIVQAPESMQHRLRCLQWRIDMAREQAKTPLAACIKISGMMWDTLHQLRETSLRLHDSPQQAVPARQKATILSFTPRKN